MSVSDASAFALLRAFGMLEFNLKRTPGFLAADANPLRNQRAKAKADWPALDRAVAALQSADFLDLVSRPTRAKLLGGARNRPQIQFVRVAADGTWSVNYEDSPLPYNDAEALVVAMRRVRNNLFHGGKEDPLQEPYPGDDEEWVEAAQEVANLLLNLLELQRLRP
ncbi:hypothetical protein [Xanthomonas sp. 3307]|uniref:hypothetical protein n=1 Tax=Xanthomonas sp. 3307 TaxID=3035316 RepID=UPI0017B8BDD7|nr:hypothetical protein [Xanthomonas sp. 3307]MBB5940788.1 hypothetical protein [Xanthomonas sp. 3307]